MKMKILLRAPTALIVISLGMSGVLVISAQTIAFNFDRNLTIGSRGVDVLELQKNLNRSLKTRLGDSGPGSPGEETTYFGPITRAAVIKYQELYTAEILTPVGLSRGTGFFGPSTRAKINSRSAVNQIDTPSSDGNIPKGGITTVNEETTEDTTDNVISTSNFSIFTFSSDSNEVILMYPSEYDGKPGDQITLSGLGFVPSSNAIHFGSKTIFNNPSLLGSQLTFIVPEVNSGRHSISVSNANGISGTISFNVLEANATLPVIDRIEPISGIGATEITIFGSGFKPTGNIIYTGYGIIKDVSSLDGTSLIVTINPPRLQGDVPEEFHFMEFDANIAKQEGLVVTGIPIETTNFTLYVENIGGFSNNATYTYQYDQGAVLKESTTL